MDLADISTFISNVGVPAAGAIGIGWLFYGLLQWMMKVIIGKLDGIEVILVKLIDRIRMMDNDLIRIDSMIRVMNDLPPDYSRIKRKEEEHHEDNRKD